MSQTLWYWLIKDHPTIRQLIRGIVLLLALDPLADIGKRLLLFIVGLNEAQVSALVSSCFGLTALGVVLIFLAIVLRG